MTTLNEDLERMANTLRHVTDEDVEVVEGSVYVNYAYATALVLTPEITDKGKRWGIMAMQWDRTGGVSADAEIALCYEHLVPAAVNAHLAEEKRREDELERLLSKGCPNE